MNYYALFLTESMGFSDPCIHREARAFIEDRKSGLPVRGGALVFAANYYVLGPVCI